MRQLFSNINKSFNTFYIQVRFKNPDHHWSVLKKKKFATAKALEHFDEFYKSVYEGEWINIRSALLSKKHKYMAVVNNYSGENDVITQLQNLGALDVKIMYDLTKNSRKEKLNMISNVKLNSQVKMETAFDDKVLEDVHSVDSRNSNTSSAQLNNQVQSKNNNKSNIDEDTDLENTNKNKLKDIPLKSIECNNEINIASNRIIDSSVGFAASSLYDFIPPTKIKGAEDWVYESDHYKFYTKGDNFQIQVKKESKLRFPKYLHLYAFEQDSDQKFPKPGKSLIDVSEYYLFDGASSMPVLALDLQPGDKVLDMCAAPGGKALTILQTLMPAVLVANDISQSRVNRIHKVFDEYLSNEDRLKERLFITKEDARFIEDKDIYNKILVDVPCTTDRLCLHENENNYFQCDRLKERLQLPQLQTEILTNALKLISLGGTVVYSTCSLSPVQNEGVVKMAMKKIWEESDSVMIIKDMSEAIEPLSYFYKFQHCSHGHLIVPTTENNWGPMYFCKIQRIR